MEVSFIWMEFSFIWRSSLYMEVLYMEGFIVCLFPIAITLLDLLLEEDKEPL